MSTRPGLALSLRLNTSGVTVGPQLPQKEAALPVRHARRVCNASMTTGHADPSGHGNQRSCRSNCPALAFEISAFPLVHKSISCLIFGYMVQKMRQYTDSWQPASIIET